MNPVTFRTYLLLKALCAAYVAEIKSPGDNPLPSNYGNCRSGLVSGDQAAGRVFCTETNAGFQMVWTQNSGFMMAIMMGGPHLDAWSWWLAVHHNIAFPGTKPMHM